VIKKEKTRNTFINAKRPMSTLEDHFVIYAGLSSDSGVLGNGQLIQKTQIMT